MIFRRLINVQYFSLVRNYCQSEKPGVCSPSTIQHTKGDKGISSTLSGQQYYKDHNIFHVIGIAEELLCFLGVAKEHAKESNHEYCDKLKRIQTVVIEISTAISRSSDESKHQITDLHIKEIEEWIKIYSNELPPPEKYIIPGSGITSATLQLARSICRKAERYVTPFVRKGQINPEIQIYLNRLSDFLLMISRIAAKLDKQNELIYVPKPGFKVQEQ